MYRNKAQCGLCLLAAVMLSIGIAAAATDEDEYIDDAATTLTAWSSPATVNVGDQTVKVHFGSRQIYLISSKTATKSPGSPTPQYSASCGSAGKILVFAGDQPIDENRHLRNGKETTELLFSSTNRKVMTIDDRGSFQVVGPGVAIVTVSIGEQTVCIPFQVTELPLKEGMSADEVITALGPPDKRTISVVDPSQRGSRDGKTHHAGVQSLTVLHWQYNKYPGLIFQFRGSDRLSGCFQPEWSQHSLLECKLKN